MKSVLHRNIQPFFWVGMGEGYVFMFFFKSIKVENSFMLLSGK